MDEESPLTPQGLLRWIVCSLYVDEAIPRGAVLQWYWQLLTGVKLTQQQLVALIESTPGVFLDPPGSRRLNFRAVLEVPPPSFRGFVQEEENANPEDIVAPDVWEEVRRCLAKGGWPKCTDSGVRNVSVAAWLQDQSEILSEITFGRLLQVVMISANKSKLLGLRDGALVPYKESEEYERFSNAEAGKPTGVKSNESFIETWEDLRDCLRKLIYMSPRQEIEISQVKLQCRSKLRKELSETVFGHHSLSRLLEDERLSDFERTGDPTTRPCITLRGSRVTAKAYELKSKGTASGAGEGEDPWTDPSKDPWSGAKGKGKDGKGAKNMLAKALPANSAGKGAKVNEPAKAPAKDPPGKSDKDFMEAEILLAEGKKATLKIPSKEQLIEAAERFCKEQGVEEHQSQLSAWLEKQAESKQDNVTLNVVGDMKMITDGA
ncbi:unnamed protein product [Durusdinium trenchii]|uniref:Uncharacterized protein n=2 Tax=Durusdinium trenchii TaxID=1381693 RepID=A0ABP0N4N1_9DINO